MTDYTWGGVKQVYLKQVGAPVTHYQQEANRNLCRNFQRHRIERGKFARTLCFPKSFHFQSPVKSVVFLYITIAPKSQDCCWNCKENKKKIPVSHNQRPLSCFKNFTIKTPHFNHPQNQSKIILHTDDTESLDICRQQLKLEN